MTGLSLHLVVEDIPASVDFYRQAFGARLTRELRLPDGSIVIADLLLDDLPLALAAAIPGTSLATPRSTGTSVAAYRFAVQDAEGAMERAVSAGATVHSPVQDAFWGVRTGEVLDPSGHRWAFDQRLREVTVEELESRLAAMFGST